MRFILVEKLKEVMIFFFFFGENSIEIIFKIVSFHLGNFNQE